MFVFPRVFFRTAKNSVLWNFNVYLPLASLSRTKEWFSFLLRTQAKAKVMNKGRAQRKLAEWSSQPREGCALSSLLRTLARLSTGPCWSLLGAGIPESGLVLHCYRISTASYVPRFLLRCIAPTLVTKGNRRDPGIWYGYYVEHSSPIVFTPAPLVGTPPKHLHVLEWKGASQR